MLFYYELLLTIFLYIYHLYVKIAIVALLNVCVDLHKLLLGNQYRYGRPSWEDKSIILTVQVQIVTGCPGLYGMYIIYLYVLYIVYIV